MKRRFLSILLSICMATWLVPTSAFAAPKGSADGASSAIELTVLLSSGLSADGMEVTTEGTGKVVRVVGADGSIDPIAVTSQDGGFSDKLASAVSEQPSFQGNQLKAEYHADDDTLVITGNPTQSAELEMGSILEAAESSLAKGETDATADAAVAANGGESEAAGLATASATAHVHPDCGRADCTDASHTAVEWQAWDKADSLPYDPGTNYYYLTTDVTLSQTWQVSAGYTPHICLNGHTITGPSGDSVINIASGNLTITDCHSGDQVGKITHRSGETGKGVGIGAGTFTMWNGTITGNTAGFGAGVENDSTFNMYGGTITGNNISKESYYGGHGGGVANYGRFNISGDATVSGNTGRDSGNDNVYVSSKSRINVEGAGMGSGAKVGVNAENPLSSPTVVTGSTDLSVFFGDNENYPLKKSGANSLRIASGHQHAICGTDGCDDPDHENIEWTLWSSDTSLPTESGYYYLTCDVALSQAWEVAAGKNVNLCLNGKSILGKDEDSVVRVAFGGSLTITDCHTEATGLGKIMHESGQSGAGVENHGSLTLWNGSITGNTAGVVNGASESGSDALFTMVGGEITGNASLRDGAGVYNYQNNTFAMVGGKIYGNTVTGTSSNGAGVFNGGTFQISGDAQVTGNNAADNSSSNVFLWGTTITAIGEMGDSASVGISTGNPTASPVVATGLTTAKGFFADDTSHSIEADGAGNLRLVTHKHGISGESGSGEESLSWTPVSALGEIEADGNYYLTDNVTLSETWVCTYKVNLCLDGHSITGPDGNRAIYVSPNASLNITDCHNGDELGKITHAQNATGGAIENAGSLTLWNGSISGNSADFGGGVYNTTDSTFTMRGGSITGNSAQWGGGVRNEGAFEMLGGYITGNAGEIAGGGVYDAGTLKASGEITISENTVGGEADNLYLPSGKTIAVASPLSDAAKVGVTAQQPGSEPTVAVGTTSSTGFVSDSDRYRFIADGDGGLKLTAEHIHAVCGKADCGDEGHGNIKWTAWESTDSLPSEAGNYYLASDVTLSGTWRVESEIKLCLNGKSITSTGSGAVATVANSGNLTITDCEASFGKITHAGGAQGSGIENYGTFTLWNGAIAGNVADQGAGVSNWGAFNLLGGSIANNTASSQGGGVWNQKTFVMSGGSISGNSAGSDGNVGQGGGVFTSLPSGSTHPEDVTFTMTGGSITGNNVTGGEAAGGGVYGSSYFYMCGDVVIQGNAVGGTIVDGSLSGGSANNAYLNQRIQVQGSGMGSAAKVGITSSDPANPNHLVVAGTTSTAGFFSDSGNYSLTRRDAEGLCLVQGHNHAVCGENGCPDEHESIEWQEWTATGSLPTQAGNYFLTSDVELPGTWRVDADVKLCLGGHTITCAADESAIYVSPNGNLVITDCGSGDSLGKVTHAAYKSGSGVSNDGTFTLWGGLITGNNAQYKSGYEDSGNGGGVNNRSTGTFNMFGGSISGNTASGSGGGVYNNGTLVMSGNVVVDGNTKDGAANNVCISNDHIIHAELNRALGATAKVGITSTDSSDDAAAVDGTADAGAFFSDNDGYELVAEGENRLALHKLDHQHGVCGEADCADSSHGSVLVWKPISSLSDIAANGNYYLKSNIDLSDTWECTYKVNLCLNGKNITGADGKDAIKVAEDAELAITDCQESAGAITHSTGGKSRAIANSSTGGNGRGIANYGLVSLWNASVTGNAAESLGGGIYNAGALALHGGSVDGNSASYGGGVYNAGTLAVSGGQVSDNVASHRGGGVYNDGSLEVTGGSITTNAATLYGGGVYQDGSDLKLSGTVKISDNTVGAADKITVGNVCLNSKLIQVDSDSLSADSRVGVSAMKPMVVSTVVTGSTSTDVFTSDFNGFSLENNQKEGLDLSTVTVDISDVKLLDKQGGTEMAGNIKVYDGNTVTCDYNSTKVSLTVTDAALVYKWQQKTGDTYTNISGNTAPKAAGEYQLVVTYERAGVVFGKAEVPFSITAKELQVASLNVADKTYDGTASAAVNGLRLEGIASGDSVSAAVTDAKFADKNAGDNKAVTATIKLYGSDASNYTVAWPEGAYGSVKPKELTLSALAQDKVYDGTTVAEVSDLWFDGDLDGDDVSANDDKMVVTAAFEDANVGEGKTVNVTVTGLELTGKDACNYTLTQPSGVTADIVAYEPTGAEYSATTSDLTNHDFTVTAAEGWKLSLTNAADGNWSDSLSCSDDTNAGTLTFYAKNVSQGFISQSITLSYKIDKTAPVITGAQDGGTYYGPLALTISDANLDAVALNGVAVELSDGTLTLQPAEGVQTVVAIDKAGNSTSLNVTVSESKDDPAGDKADDGGKGAPEANGDNAESSHASEKAGVARTSDGLGSSVLPSLLLLAAAASVVAVASRRKRTK